MTLTGAQAEREEEKTDDRGETMRRNDDDMETYVQEKAFL